MNRISDELPTSRRLRSAAARAAGGLLALAVAVSLSACGGGEDAGGMDQGGDMEGSDGMEGDGGQPSVRFVQPGDGDTVTSPVQIVFGSSDIQVAAVPDTVEQAREGTIHYHLGVDTDCLSPGTRIPSASPWIHFGDGSSEIEQQLSPGEHRLTVQAGDDEHMTIEGLCETITVTVTEGG